MSKTATKSYDNDTLTKLKVYELEILKDFIDVCEENNLVYFGFAGTGIGALRHGGFIPWDDDIDVAMPRKDYDKMVSVFEEKYSEKYTVVNAEKYNDFPVMNTHIIINDSSFITSEELKLKYPKGIFLDIFPLDNIPDDDTERQHHLKKVWFLSKLLILKHIPFPHLPIKSIKAKLEHCVTALVWLFLNIFCISHKFLYNLCINSCTKYNNVNTKSYGYTCGTKPGSNIFDKEKLFPLRKIKYENIELNFPNNLEETLTLAYGDFMQLPPEQDRKNHRPEILVFPNEKIEV